MVLVTGASGLIGSHLIQALLQQGQEVTALYRNTIPVLTDTDTGIHWVQGDILDVVFLEELMPQITQVYHCAAAVSFDAKDKQTLYQTNIEGTANVVNACLQGGVQKLVFVSSVAALGRSGKAIPITEQMHWDETAGGSEYGRTKYLAEMEVWRAIGEGLNAVIVNPVIVLGNGDWNKSSTTLFKTAYREFAWYTNGTTGFVDVLDVVNAMLLLMNSHISAERFILCGSNTSYKAFFYSVATNFNKRPPHKYASPFLAQLVWRLASVGAFFTGKKPVLTRETAHTAQAKISYDNTKLLNALPEFSYTPLETTILRVCNELKNRYNL